MLDHFKPYVDKRHSINAELHINWTWNCKVCVGVAFLWLLCACLPSLTTFEWTDQQHLAKTKMEYISLPSILNAIIGITSYYCIILKMVILHDAVKTIFKMFFLCFSLKKNKNLFLFKKEKCPDGLFFFQKPRFFSTLTWRHPSSQRIIRQDVCMRIEK